MSLIIYNIIITIDITVIMSYELRSVHLIELIGFFLLQLSHTIWLF